MCHCTSTYVSCTYEHYLHTTSSFSFFTSYIITFILYFYTGLINSCIEIVTVQESLYKINALRTLRQDHALPPPLSKGGKTFAIDKVLKSYTSKKFLIYLAPLFKGAVARKSDWGFLRANYNIIIV